MTSTFYFNVKYWSRQYFESSDSIISQTVADMVQVTIDNEWELFMSLWLAYLHLTLAHSKGEGQSQAHIDNKYLGNGDI